MAEGRVDHDPVDIVETLGLVGEPLRQHELVPPERTIRAVREIAPRLAPRAGAGKVEPQDDRLIHRRLRPELAPSVPDPDVRPKRLPRRPVDVGPSRDLVLPVVADRPFLPIEVRREEVSNRLAAPADRGADRTQHPGAERGSFTGVAVLLVGLRAEPVSSHREAHRPVVGQDVELLDASVLGPVVLRLEQLLRVGQPRRPLLGGDLDLRSPRPPTLGHDLDDPVGGLGAVNRRRRRPLDDLDRLDLVWIEVVDPRVAVASIVADLAVEERPRRPRRRIVVHPHPVDVQQRIGSERDARRTPQPRRPTRPDVAARRLKRQPGHLGRQNVLQRGGRRDFFQRHRIDPRHRITIGSRLLL